MKKQAKKSNNHEFTPPEMSAIWYALTDVMDYNETRGEVFEAMRKRIMAKIQPELKFWYDLPRGEQEVLASEKISFSFSKIPADALPEVLPDHTHHGLSLIVEGEIPVYKPKLAEILKRKKETKPEKA